MIPNINKRLYLIIFSLLAISLSSCTNTEYGEGTPGQLVWRTSLLKYTEVNSSPAVLDGKVYVGSGYWAAGFSGVSRGGIYCLDTETGHAVWSRIYMYQLGNPDHVEASPAVTNGKLYLHDGVYDAETGEKFWSLEIKTPAVANEHVYLTSQSGITCVSDNRTNVWETSTEYSGYWADPAVYNGNVYSKNENGKVVCFNGATGAVVWEMTIQDDRIGPISVTDGLVYFISSQERTIKCVNADTGDSVWNYQITTGPDSKPALKDGYVYITQSNRMYCLDALVGTKIWEQSYGDLVNFNSNPAVTEKYIYIGAGNLLLCFNRLTGEKEWSYETEDSVDSSPAVVDGKVYVGSDDGWLYCIKAPADEDGYWPMYGYNPARTGSADEE